MVVFSLMSGLKSQPGYTYFGAAHSFPSHHRENGLILSFDFITMHTNRYELSFYRFPTIDKTKLKWLKPCNR